MGALKAEELCHFRYVLPETGTRDIVMGKGSLIVVEARVSRTSNLKSHNSIY